MSGAMHPETKPQRAPKSAQPEEKRKQGYEERDAPPGKVALGVAGFYAVILIALAFAAVTIVWLKPGMGLSPRAPQPPLFPEASLPPLLADPVANRRAVEDAARRNLDPARIGQAMREVEARQQGGAR